LQQLQEEAEAVVVVGVAVGVVWVAAGVVG
jgi:hypothetical protein